MHTPSRLVACPSCSCHYRAEEPGCPHCGSSSTSGRAAAALLLGLTLTSGCFGKSVAMYGVAITDPEIFVQIDAPEADARIDAPGDVTAEATVNAYNVGDLAGLDLAWSVDDVAACDDAALTSDGDTTCVATLTAGDHTIAVTVTDPESGANGSAATIVHVGSGAGTGQ